MKLREPGSRSLELVASGTAGVSSRLKRDERMENKRSRQHYRTRKLLALDFVKMKSC
jgi:hypothetical protein